MLLFQLLRLAKGKSQEEKVKRVVEAQSLFSKEFIVKKEIGRSNITRWYNRTRLLGVVIPTEKGICCCALVSAFFLIAREFLESAHNFLDNKMKQKCFSK